MLGLAAHARALHAAVMREKVDTLTWIGSRMPAGAMFVLRGKTASPVVAPEGLKTVPLMLDRVIRIATALHALQAMSVG